MGISVNGNNSVSGVSKVEASSANKTNKNSGLFESDAKAAQEKQKAKEDLETRVTELLDLKDNFLKANIVEQNGKVYLKLSRPLNDKERPNERHDFSMSALKSKLGLKDGVLKKNNNLKDVTGRDLYEESGSATIEPGKSLIIPLSDLGQDFSWYQFGKKDLVEYVQKYLDCR